MPRPEPNAAALVLAVLVGLASHAHAAPGGFAGVWLEPEGAARVADVAPGSPAEQAGLRRGDLLLTIDGEPCSDAASAAARLTRAAPGERLRLALRRARDRLEVELNLGTWGAYRRAQPAASAPAPPGEAILLAGVEVPIGAPVVTWRHPRGFDGYQETCAFRPEALPQRPAPGCDEPRRYAARRNLPAPVAEVVAARGFSPDLAAVVLDQVVLHYDVAWTSKNCFKVLHDLRGLSCHFLLDVDGTLYQTLDLTERARHAGSANDRSIGIEIAHPGPLELTQGLAARYTRDERGVRFDLGRLAADPRTPGFVVRPARPDPIRAEVQGRTYTQYDFTDAQYRTLTRLLVALHRALPRIRLDAPRDAAGNIRTAVLSPEEQASFSGLLGHYHVSAHKQDPGPAFDWERVLTESRRLASRAGH